MLRYAFIRLLSAIPALLILITLTFFMMRAAPGGPFDRERDVSPEVRAKLEQAYHLDESLWKQYGRYLTALSQGDLGPSFKYGDRSVNELIAVGFPVSLKIGGLAMLLALLLGGALGIVAALKQNGVIDYGVMTLAMVGISIPNYVFAPLAILLFAVTLGWLPAGGWNDGALSNLVLPVLALAAPQVAYIARLMRGSMIEVLHAPYIRTARAKGLSERVVILRHALRPALLPVLSYLGPASAGIITGSVVIEQIFGIPGIGRYFVTAALNRDYTVVMGVVIFYGVLVILFNFLVDLLYGVLDPRARPQ
ncbi:oligopeptide ABC transporter permease OppB [Stenotrophobium rhamnosiphilum]|uniref:Oligopeptide ABC transporter permease OppB n=1 Tax=Stenotrophobium rhamnosiphilum TaxID=2029166 RepID=A0A2T5MDS2_9GAMM|nr:oligopeptide ABC transporter permease OppB [Stenotrophobium rhamnosiphilum]PTU30730.1 oligopeptide ABC transporter permease OppB [Stenotrophobium rhamnosiphilum]